jgi:alpha-beta hydrolase superfamily lysophospholipase
MQSFDLDRDVQEAHLDIDVTDAAALGEPATIAMTVTLPNRTGDQSVVCFAKPGAGFSRRYFTDALPGPARGAQAAWHAERGWVFVAGDHLGAGTSSSHDADRTASFGTLVDAAHAAEEVVLQRLRAGTLVPGFPPLADPLVLGIGHSMGGCLTVVQQAHHRTYHGIAVLGYSVLHLRTPSPPGRPAGLLPWRVRGAPEIVLNEPMIARDTRTSVEHFEDAAWSFFADDVDRELVRLHDPSAPWYSMQIPSVIGTVTTPGSVASEAAGVDVPVLLAMGDRDVVVDPAGEPRAYLSSPSIDLFVCPSMGHLHNFASTRELLWRRLDTWAAWAGAWRGA